MFYCIRTNVAYKAKAIIKLGLHEENIRNVAYEVKAIITLGRPIQVINFAMCPVVQKSMCRYKLNRPRVIKKIVNGFRFNQKSI